MQAQSSHTHAASLRLLRHRSFKDAGAHLSGPVMPSASAGVATLHVPPHCLPTYCEASRGAAESTLHCQLLPSAPARVPLPPQKLAELPPKRPAPSWALGAAGELPYPCGKGSWQDHHCNFLSVCRECHDCQAAGVGQTQAAAGTWKAGFGWQPGSGDCRTQREMTLAHGRIVASLNVPLLPMCSSSRRRAGDKCGVAGRCTEAALSHEHWGAAVRVCMAAKHDQWQEMRAAQAAVAGKQRCQRHQHGAGHSQSQMPVGLRRL